MGLRLLALRLLLHLSVLLLKFTLWHWRDHVIAPEYVRQVRLLLTLFDEAKQRYEGHRAIAGQQAASEA